MNRRRKPTEEELTRYPYDHTDPIVFEYPEDIPNFNCKWHGIVLVKNSHEDPWRIERPTPEPDILLTKEHWKEYYPGITHVDVTNWFDYLEGEYKGKYIRWSKSTSTWVGRNNRERQLPPDPDPDVEEVDRALQTSLDALHRLTPAPEAQQSPVPGEFPSTPGASTSQETHLPTPFSPTEATGSLLSLFCPPSRSASP